MLIVLNFSSVSAQCNVGFNMNKANLMLTNYHSTSPLVNKNKNSLLLRPYEAKIYSFSAK